MAATKVGETTKRQKWGWGVSIGLGAVLVLNGIVLYFIETEKTVSILLTGFGALALVVALAGFRGAPWAWNATWVVFGTLAVLTAQFLAAGDRVDLAGTYGFCAVVAGAAQGLAWGGTQRTATEGTTSA